MLPELCDVAGVLWDSPGSHGLVIRLAGGLPGALPPFLVAAPQSQSVSVSAAGRRAASLCLWLHQGFPVILSVQSC